MQHNELKGGWLSACSGTVHYNGYEWSMHEFEIHSQYCILGIRWVYYDDVHKLVSLNKITILKSKVLL